MAQEHTPQKEHGDILEQKGASPFPPLHSPSGEVLEENCNSPIPPIYNTDDAGEE